MTQPAPDRLKFTTIAHATHRYLSPLSAEKATRLVDGLALREGAEVLDIGCGRAGFLLDLCERSPANGLGVDINSTFIAAARAEASRRGLDARVRLVDRALADVVGDAARFDAIVCMGSSQALGTFVEALAWAYAHLAPGGVALFADGFWRRRPDPGYLEALGGATEDEMNTHAGNTRLAREAGFRVLSTACASEDEWDAYEGRYCAAIERYVDANPTDPDTPAMAARIRAWHEAYLTWGRDTLGFGFYTLMKPAAHGL
ncbi:SAM-dependent methyltransferase [Polyangium spumosum]|nr:class I SAM-dependent methyltransferase [Polyangium spumosum]